MGLELEQGKLKSLILSVQHNTLKGKGEGTTEDIRAVFWLEDETGGIVSESERAVYVQWRTKQARNQQRVESLLNEALKTESHPSDYSVLYVLELFTGASGLQLELLLQMQISRAYRWMNTDIPAKKHQETFMNWLKDEKELILGAYWISRILGVHLERTSLGAVTRDVHNLLEKTVGVPPMDEMIESNITKLNSKLDRAERHAGNISELQERLDIVKLLIDRER